MSRQFKIGIKTKEEIVILQKAGKILSRVIKGLKRSLTSGMTTKDIDTLAEKLINEYGAKPAFKGYRGFPGCVCTSINEEVVHGIPSNRILNDGDIISIDAGLIYEGYYSDTAFTTGVGRISSELKKLIKTTEQSLYQGIKKAKVGNHLTDISNAIQSHVESNSFSVVREFVGHGIGKNLHEDPEIPNFGNPGEGPVLEEGMIFAIEPMVNVGSWKTDILDDGWTVVTKDRKPSAHFEHTIAILKNGPLILTK
ncbi:MAG: type I methionyl aminopeptidase [Candidatus Zapsychrus exili]|nr:type I methionyl aminopeptidase [Candidatus Zapsychrus exili]